ncbi:NAD-dependent epimerase/dehydratase family protein [Zavarzinia compransoris]|uniref:NAD(P)-dependent oxidoreductase n=1 Tax=Zavarzinia compransoris TaxID=1264899 RepID=A0A317E4Y4_9PROT|nr:NAD-dependent epimerase/dehydratase family protein [Zavarzinia compransoris]PWR22127.1 NAD(P)-dependent oxidoreductase [Zavarzinia compransoris]TDP47124.1 nucleoside-diphosphate-sugar epimerase [Zavarzinia compransoris]
MTRLFCFGLGYTALALADLLQAEGIAVAGTVRSPEKAAQLRARGIEAHVLDRGRPLDAWAAALAGTTHLLSSVPPDEAGDPVIDRHGPDLRRLSGILWAGYISTTGVYGDRAGGWVDEDSPLAPAGPRGTRRVAAEAAWAATGLPLHLFRLPGIYGPGRSALDQLRAGRAQAVVKPGQVFSRIHVADLARALRASMARPNPGRAYNICDDEASPSVDVLDHAADLLGLPRLARVDFETAEMSPMARSFWSESKRVSNRRLKAELGLDLLYPTYRHGLAAILAGEGGDGRRPAVP